MKVITYYLLRMVRAATSHFLRLCFRCCSSTISHQNSCQHSFDRLDAKIKIKTCFFSIFCFDSSQYIDIVFVAISSFFFCLAVVVVANVIELRHKIKADASTLFFILFCLCRRHRHTSKPSMKINRVDKRQSMI